MCILQTLVPWLGPNKEGSGLFLSFKTTLVTNTVPRLSFLPSLQRYKKDTFHTCRAPSVVSGLERDSVILLEQVRTIDKRRLKRRVAKLDEEIMKEVDEALSISWAKACMR